MPQEELGEQAPHALRIQSRARENHAKNIALSPFEFRRTLPDDHASSFRGVVGEFLAALRDRFTYSPRSNGEILFGFLWGLPIPFFAIAVHVLALGEPWSFETVERLFIENPYQFVFVLHPFLFAIVFGALGTMRAHRDLRIAQSLATERQNSERVARSNTRLLELDRMKDEFLANVTHELKSPLVAALGYSDRVLKGNGLLERQRHDLEVAHRNLLRLRGLIDEILDYARMASGKFDLKPQRVDLREIVSGLFESTDLRAREKHVRLEQDLAGGALTVNADPGKIHQLLLNLLDNAIKFSTPETTVRLTVRPENNHWHITVLDQGIGIEAGVLPRLFERFSQADGSRARCHEGVGLGLVIAKKIVEMHGGRIWLESVPSTGTTAHVVLPRADAVTEPGPRFIDPASKSREPASL